MKGVGRSRVFSAASVRSLEFKPMLRTAREVDDLIAEAIPFMFFWNSASSNCSTVASGSGLRKQRPHRVSAAAFGRRAGAGQAPARDPGSRVDSSPDW